MRRKQKANGLSFFPNLKSHVAYLKTMKHSNFIACAVGFGVAMHPLVRTWSKPVIGDGLKVAWPPKPVFIYNNRSAYDELSDRFTRQYFASCTL
jgi:hypothetical protein